MILYAYHKPLLVGALQSRIWLIGEKWLKLILKLLVEPQQS